MTERLRGALIVVEGLDGSGLSTQADMLKQALENQGREVFLAKEPSAGPAGAMIRLALAHRLQAEPNGRGDSRLDEETLALLFAADRMDHLHNELLPKLRTGITIISDRYYLSSLAYQSLRVDFDWLKQINSRAYRPDLTIFLDVPPEVCVRRMHKQRWHVELYEQEDELRRVREQYLHAIMDLRSRAERIEVVDGVPPPNEVQRAIARLVRGLLGHKSTPEDGSRIPLWDTIDKEIAG